MRGLCSNGEVLYLDCINSSTLILTLYYTFVKYYHWGKVGQGYKGFLRINSYNYTQIYIYLNI